MMGSPQAVAVGGCEFVIRSWFPTERRGTDLSGALSSFATAVHSSPSGSRSFAFDSFEVFDRLVKDRAQNTASVSSICEVFACGDSISLEAQKDALQRH